MGSQALESTSNEDQEIYRIVTYPASKAFIEFESLIMASFLNSLRYGNDLFKLIERDAYYKNYKIYVESLLKRPTSMVRCALLDDNTALGWCLYQDKTLHYVWIKKEVRRQGIGKSLLPKEFDTISHITNVGINIWVNKYKDVRFNPYL